MKIFEIKKTVVLRWICLLLSAATMPASAEIKVERGVFYDTEDETDGVRILPVSESTWHSGWMTTSRFDVKNTRWTEKDYFVLEYGIPCDFSKGNILRQMNGMTSVPANVRNGALEFSTGSKGAALMLGAQPQKESIPPLRLGSFYGKNLFEHLIMELTIDNGEEECSEWRLDKMNMRFFAYENGRPFQIRGRGIQTFAYDLGYIRKILFSNAVGGLRLNALTPGRRARILKIAIAPKSAEVNWRTEFELPFVPERAPFTFQIGDSYELYVNGRKIKEGKRLPKRVMPTVDLTKYLHQGRNVIAFRERFFGSWNYISMPAQLLAEGAVIGSKGEIVRICGSADWKYNFNQPSVEWCRSGFDTSGWKTPHVASPGNNFTYRTRFRKIPGFSGINPAHMGILDVAPFQRQYPLFDQGEKVLYTITLPSEMSGLSGHVKILNGENSQLVAVRHFTEKNRILDLALKDAGAYFLKWQLEQNGRILDALKTELVIFGPIRQPLVPYKDFESYLAKELELVSTIDCTQENWKESDFMDCRQIPLKEGESAVVTRNGLTYRETGSTAFDSFSFRLPKLELGTPYLIEVQVPDDKNRYVYTRIIESHPVPFRNNDPGYLGNPVASGTSSCGGEFPLSGKMKTIRYVYVPGSRRASISIMNGAATSARSAGAAGKINFYRFKSIPALKLPENGNGRLFGQHTERNLLPWWTAAYNAVEGGMNFALSGHTGQWVNSYRALKTYIQIMRFLGHNMVMQGAYMYFWGIPLERYCEASLNDRMDIYKLFAGMYRRNHIAMYMVMEFLHPQFLFLEGKAEVSDRQIWLKKGRGIYNVDKNGNQVIGINGSGINPFSREFRKGFKELLRDIYKRYDGDGIRGMMIVCGNWWSPAISYANMRHLSVKDISFDDDTIEQFENDTGIKLHADEPGRERFMKRYQLLTGKYEKEWTDWRVRKIRSLWKEVEEIFRSGKDQWEILIKGSVAFTNQDNPYLSMSSTYRERTEGIRKNLESTGYRESLYRGNGIRLVPSVISTTYSEFTDTLADRGISESSSMTDMIRRQNVVYSGGTNLNERGTPRQGSRQPWWWSINYFCGNLKRPIGEYAFAKEIRILRDAIPRIIIDNWMDNNLCLSHDDQARRFLQAFYATPQLEWNEAENIKGVDAVQSGTFLRLVNASGNKISGRLEFSGEAKELVMEKIYRSADEIVMNPMDQLVLKLEGSGADVKGRFHFAPEIEKEIMNTAAELQKVGKVRRKIHRPVWRSLEKAFQEKDAYRVLLLLNGYEIASRAEAFYRSRAYLATQRELEEQLRKNGCARINAGGGRVTDQNGNVWLPDQPYTGYGAYGNEFAKRADRDHGNPVKDSEHPEIYFTEAFGTTVFYTIPLPAGKYEITLFAAETYPGNAQKGRTFQAEVNKHKKIFDLYQMTPGFLHEARHSWNVKVREDEPVVVKLTGECGLNGILIRKKGD